MGNLFDYGSEKLTGSVVPGRAVRIIIPLAFGRATPATAQSNRRLFWHGSSDAVARRQFSGLFVDGTGNGRMFWTTTKQLDELGPLSWKVGGNHNVRLFPPGLINKGGLEATYALRPADVALFRRAWGPGFNWNPYQWWKGAAGQFYYRPVPATWGQRFAELGHAGLITGATGGGTYVILVISE